MSAMQLEPFSLVPLALGALVAIPLCWYGLGELRLAHRVLRVRPDSALDAPDGGRIELRGTARPVDDETPLRSPFSDTPCLVCEYEVEEYDSSGKGSNWTTVDSGTEWVPFRLEDDTGSVRIEPAGADFRLERDERIAVDGGTEPPEPIARYIDRTEAVDCQNGTLDLRLFELKTGSDRRFIERLLVPGEAVHVLGTARYDTTVSRAAGQVNAVVGAADAAAADSRWLRLRHALVGDPFVVSDGSERRLGLRAGIYGIGSLAVAAFAVWIAVSWAF